MGVGREVRGTQAVESAFRAFVEQQQVTFPLRLEGEAQPTAQAVTMLDIVLLGAQAAQCAAGRTALRPLSGNGPNLISEAGQRSQAFQTPVQVDRLDGG